MLVHMSAFVLVSSSGVTWWLHEWSGTECLLVCLASGVLYYADHAANGVKASQYIKEIHNKQDLGTFINQQDDNVLTVLDVSLRNAAPCIHIFPAVLALAKNFTGYAHFARLIGDESEETQQVLYELNVNEVSFHMKCDCSHDTAECAESLVCGLQSSAEKQHTFTGLADTH